MYIGGVNTMLSLEKELLKIRGVKEVQFDKCASELNQTIFLTNYEIDNGNYWEDRKRLKKEVIKTAASFKLVKTEDTIEDYGCHFYFVFEGVV